MAEGETSEPTAPSLDSDAEGEMERKLDRQLSLGSSAPPFEPLKFENPFSTVEITVAASNLLNLDVVSKSDPVCILYALDAAFDWVEIDRTECIKDNLNPEWSKKFTLDYKFEERQMLNFKIYDLDGNQPALENHDFLGSLKVSLGEVVSSPHGKLTRLLQLPPVFEGRSEQSLLTVVAEELGDCKKILNLKLGCRVVERTVGFRKCRPSLSISKQLDDGSWVLLHQTDQFDRTISLKMSSITSGGNLERPLRWQVFDKTQSYSSRGPKLVGAFRTNYLDLVERYRQRQASFGLVDRWKQLKNKDRTPSGYIDIQHLVLDEEITFLDHIQNGLELSITVAIDFTASNGDPSRHTSLHYKHGGMDNPYVLAIKTVGEVIQDYSSDKKFAAFGFGAKGFPAGNRVSHNFPINFKQTNPFCDGIEGVLSAYSRALKRIKLFGPTCFTPVIREQAKLASEDKTGQKYFVLLILTDGNICDPDTTRDAIIKAAELPMSIIIVGVGQENFTEMEKLDCDGKRLKGRYGKLACRDIVQFVELKRFINFQSISPMTAKTKAELTKSILAELPYQVCEWRKMFVR